MVPDRMVETGEAALAVYERGAADPSRPTVVMVHGWPDSHAVWDLVTDRLAEDHHVVTFDVRGVGASTATSGARAYALEHLAEDVAAVIDAVSPGRPVHLVGHDWGSVQGWEFVMRPDAVERVASFTSLSGPSLDLLGAAIRRRLRRRSARAVAPVIGQALRSGYTVVLSLPVIRTAMWRLGFARLFPRWLRLTEGISRDDGYPGPDLADVAVAFVPVYRTNIVPRLRRPAPRHVAVPVQVIVAVKDRYVSPSLVADVGDGVPDLRRVEVDAGHWSPRTHPDDVAGHIREHVRAVGERTVGRRPA